MVIESTMAALAAIRRIGTVCSSKCNEELEETNLIFLTFLCSGILKKRTFFYLLVN